VLVRVLSPANPRQLAFLALKQIDRATAYTDRALDKVLSKPKISQIDRNLICELVYGVVRRQRTLDALIDLLGKKTAKQQPAELRIILHLGLYQLRYFDRIPESAAVNTSVELAKINGMSKLAGVVNGLLRNYIRQATKGDPLILPTDAVTKLGILHSFPDWIVNNWLEQLSIEDTDKILSWFNRTPHIDLRVNILQTTVEKVKIALETSGISVSTIPYLPQALRLNNHVGAIAKLPGYREGWWIVQDSSAQLVSHFLDPQPGETIIDVCAAPGGKTTHIAELMGDKGQIIALDLHSKRLDRVKTNCDRLQLNSIQFQSGDSRQFEFTGQADRILLDVPCSGLGTLHKRPDIRWRQTPTTITELVRLQRELLTIAATWVKPKGILLYATCTINYLENEKVIQSFLDLNPNWELQSPASDSPVSYFAKSTDWIKIYPHTHDMDGFFIAKLQKN
jgi:16S rRNA (cytosine967-C5)-methyltransferase